ncbi:DNA binding domain-containing protein, excisionase family [Micromonospora matsumotoense]|uniref:DNA binding domain-containing protein, excisionase family n=1 Tax=Micromonospora matsumotoense TaxID=121616 RepID=A0A1C4ZWD6_9ACTN|nr:helix-turn-helix domain-containing protein [Micromonospora matsumotoense]SCF37064.1 DNA binding domain-containing protein, excisionase family [Micromonospora matsumotoense]
MSTVIPFPQRPIPTEAGGISNTRSAPVVSAVYTVAETAEILSLSLGSTYALVRSGEIPAIKLGGRWLIPKGRLHRWLDDLPEASTEDVAAELDRMERAEQRQHRRNGA